MSELKGQILGVIITLTLFATISGVMAAVFTNLTNKVKSETKEVTGVEVSDDSFVELLHY